MSLQVLEIQHNCLLKKIFQAFITLFRTIVSIIFPEESSVIACRKQQTEKSQ